MLDKGTIELPIPVTPKRLKYYSSTAQTTAIMRHNLKWAKTGKGSPRFQFFYLMLPCACNQRCRGCFMGQDKSKLPKELDGPFFNDRDLQAICGFAKKHGAQAAVHSGGGELFTWPGAFDYIERIAGFGLRMMVFTNGTLLTPADIKRLNELEVALTVSLRDTAEKPHNEIVGYPGFRKSMATIETALTEGMHLDNRLAVEIPVIQSNEGRIINDLLPVLRVLGIVPMIEEYILTSTSQTERRCAHSFAQARAFFKRLASKDAQLGIDWAPESGQRMIGEPKCRRPLFSFCVYPNGEIVNCPTDMQSHGNFRRESLTGIFYSRRFRKALSGYSLCPCSKFYTGGDEDIPPNLPQHLKES